MTSDEEFIARNQLTFEIGGIDEAAQLLPPGFEMKDLTRVVVISPKDQEQFTLPVANIDPSPSVILTVLWNYAQDGAYSTFADWKADYPAIVQAQGKHAASYFRFSRDVYLRMRRLLGPTEFKEFIDL